MSTTPAPSGQQPPRMLVCFVLTLALMLASLSMQEIWPSSLLAVTIYKAHLMALGGWGGYWLDRALFPYDRPHQHLGEEVPGADPRVPPAMTAEPVQQEFATAELVATGSFGHAMLRRAIIVAACLICVGLGA